jgi:hypothetical protein
LNQIPSCRDLLSRLQEWMMVDAPGSITDDPSEILLQRLPDVQLVTEICQSSTAQSDLAFQAAVAAAFSSGPCKALLEQLDVVPAHLEM